MIRINLKRRSRKSPIKPSNNLKRKDIYKGAVIDLALETVQIDPDKPAATLEIVHHPGGAAVVAVNDSHQVCLLRQYRHAAGQWLWELPAGKIDNREPPQQTIKRELQEEAGMTAKHWRELGHIVSSPGVLDEVLHLYLATQLTPCHTDHELHEYIEIHWLDFHKAVMMALDGEIIDAKSIIALLRAQYVLNT